MIGANEAAPNKRTRSAGQVDAQAAKRHRLLSQSQSPSVSSSPPAASLKSFLLSLFSPKSWSSAADSPPPAEPAPPAPQAAAAASSSPPASTAAKPGKRSRAAEPVGWQKIEPAESSASSASTGNFSSVLSQVIGSGGEMPPSVMISCDQHRYLFNVGEGTQRFGGEWRTHMASVSTALCTRLSWQNLGGLPDLLLTWALDREFVLVGPPNIWSWLLTTRSFVRGRTIHLTVHEIPPHCRPQLAVVDDRATGGLLIEPVVLLPGSSCSDDCDETAVVRRITLQYDVVRKWTIQPPVDCTVCYICEPPVTRGKFQVAKARALGVPAGPAYSALSQGTAIRLADGRVVQPADVVDQSTAGRVCFVLDVPTPLHFEQCRAAPRLRQFSDRLAIVYHLTPAAIFESPDYQQWLAAISAPDTRHVVFNERTTRFYPTGAYCSAYQHLLHQLHPTIYPLLATNQAPLLSHPPCPYPPLDQSNQPSSSSATDSSSSSTTESSTIDQSASGNLFSAASLQSFRLYPAHAVGFQRHCALPVHFSPSRVSDLLQTMGKKALPDGGDTLADLIQRCAELRAPPASPVDNDVLITMLGTASACPSKFRNISGIHVQAPSSNTHYLWDCAESTAGQLIRRFGYAQARHIICSLTAVFITHVHADHHLGLVEILRLRSEWGAPEPLRVIAPNRLLQWLTELDQATLDRLHFHFTSCSQIAKQDGISFAAEAPHFRVAPVEHIPDAWGIVADTAHGKVVYSGDTRAPCGSLIEAGWNARLVIHEATFEDDLAAEADAKNHSTVGQAIEAGVTMASSDGVVLLTHLSQRYDFFPPFENEYASRVMVANDYMTISMGADVGRLNLLREPVKRLFKLAANIDDLAADDERCQGATVGQWLGQQVHGDQNAEP